MTHKAIPGVRFDRLTPHTDNRGSFLEIMRANSYSLGFVQSNHSHSNKGVLRGMHYHVRQADLWYLVRGRIRVVLVDLRFRTSAPNVLVIDMGEEDPHTLYIPVGVAHGFLAEQETDLIYWTTKEYDAGDEHGIAWNDPRIGIEWGRTDPILSERDSNNPAFSWDEIPSSFS